MLAVLSLLEDEAVRSHLLHFTPLRTGLEKILAAYAEQAQQYCADAMRSVPREFERAADYAARAEAYKGLLQRLTNDLEKFSPADQPPEQ